MGRRRDERPDGTAFGLHARGGGRKAFRISDVRLNRKTAYLSGKRLRRTHRAIEDDDSPSILVQSSDGRLTDTAGTSSDDSKWGGATI